MCLRSVEQPVVEDRTAYVPSDSGTVGSDVLFLQNYCLIFLTIPDLDNCQNVKKAVSLIEAVEEKLVNKQVCSILISGLEGS